MFGFHSPPSKEWLETAKQENILTPDIAKLELSDFHLVFICDNLMRLRAGYNSAAQWLSPLNTVYTKERFSFYKYTKENKEIFLPLRDGVRPIRGELHVTTTEGLQFLDKLYDNGVQFLRERVKVIMPFRTVYRQKNKTINGKPLPPCLDNIHTLLSPEMTKEIRVHMYVANPKMWLHRLDNGYLFQRIPTFYPNKLRSWLSEYYFYVEKCNAEKRSE